VNNEHKKIEVEEERNEGVTDDKISPATPSDANHPSVAAHQPASAFIATTTTKPPKTVAERSAASVNTSLTSTITSIGSNDGGGGGGGGRGNGDRSRQQNDRHDGIRATDDALISSPASLSTVEAALTSHGNDDADEDDSDDNIDSDGDNTIADGNGNQDMDADGKDDDVESIKNNDVGASVVAETATTLSQQKNDNPLQVNTYLRIKLTVSWK
jgi:hypothetical protein